MITETTKLHYTLGAITSLGVFFRSEENILLNSAAVVSLIYSGLACRSIGIIEGFDDLQEISKVEGKLKDEEIFEHIANRDILAPKFYSVSSST